MAANVMEIYGKYVFNEHVMKERLPSATYKSLKATLEKGQPLDIESSRAPPITPTGSSRSPASPVRSTMVSSAP